MIVSSSHDCLDTCSHREHLRAIHADSGCRQIWPLRTRRDPVDRSRRGATCQHAARRLRRRHARQPFRSFWGALAAGLIGFAFSAIAGAILLHFTDPIAAVPLLLACSITTQFMSIAKLWRTMEWRGCLPLLAGGFIGIPIGGYLLQTLPPGAFVAVFGSFLACYSLLLSSPPVRAHSRSPPRPRACALLGTPTQWCRSSCFAQDRLVREVNSFGRCLPIPLRVNSAGRLTLSERLIRCLKSPKADRPDRASYGRAVLGSFGYAGVIRSRCSLQAGAMCRSTSASLIPFV